MCEPSREIPMPTYDYECDACGHTFEKFQSIKANRIRMCPACRAKKVRRLIGTGGGIIFKGSGFYQTDYRSESYKKDAKAESDAKSGKKDGKDGDSKKSTGDSGGGKSTTTKETSSTGSSTSSGTSKDAGSKD